MPPTGPLELAIASTWDGQPVPPGEVVRLRVALRGPDLEVEVDAPFHGDPPPAGPPGPCWGLWEHEAAELFVLGAGGRYTELELGPHGHHLLLRLEGRRRVVARELPVRYEARLAGGRWAGVARLARAHLPPGPHRINAYALHGAGAARRHLALHPVPGAAPDFHRLEAFRAADLPALS